MLQQRGYRTGVLGKRHRGATWRDEHGANETFEGRSPPSPVAPW